jgi:hypothetical protein
LEIRRLLNHILCQSSPARIVPAQRPDGHLRWKWRAA